MAYFALSPTTGLVLGAFCSLAVPLSYYVTKWKTLHNHLAQRIEHDSKSGDGSLLAEHSDTILSLPQDVIQNASDFIVFYDQATKQIPISALPAWDQQQLLTTYMRHTMGRFASMPQAWILWLLSDTASKQTFTYGWILKLKFQTGDQVCGNYVVRHRSPNQAEFAMSMGKPDHRNYIDCRLVITLKLDQDKKRAIFQTQTLMWRKKQSTTVMPLERSLPKWAHQLASWSLIDSGTKHLVQLNDKQGMEGLNIDKLKEV